MAYKPQNVAKYRDDSAAYPKGSGPGGGGSGNAMVPGSTGSQDRGSQPVGAEFFNDGQKRISTEGTFDLAGNERNPRSNPNFGRASYGYEKPTL